MATSDPIAGLTRALDAAEQIVAGIGGEQWSGPTGCPAWNVRELLSHLVGGNRVFAALLTGEAPPDWRADHLDGDPLASYRSAATALQAAFA